jgi:hypothetical protein
MKSNILFFGLVSILFSLTSFGLQAQCTGDWVLPFEAPEGGQPWGTTIGPDNTIYVSFNFIETMILPSNDGQSETLQTQIPNGSSIGVAAYSPEGNLLWYNVFSGGSGLYFGYTLAIADDALFLAGTFISTLEIGSILLEATSSSLQEAFYARIDPANGEVVWASQFVSEEWASNLGMTVNPAGNLLLTGFFIGNSIVPGGWELSDGGGVGAGQRHFYLIEVNPETGAATWVQQSEPSEANGLIYHRGWGLTTDAAGQIYVSGMYSNRLEIDGQVLLNEDVPFLPFVGKFASDGTCLWLRGPEGVGNPGGFQPSYAVAIDPDGSVYFSGAAAGSLTFAGQELTLNDEEGIFLVKYNGAGDFQWGKIFGDDISDGISEWGSVLTWQDDRLLVTANVNGNPLVDGVSYEGNGLQDVGFFEFDGEGQLLDAEFMGGSAGESTYVTVLDSFGDKVVFGFTASPLGTYGSAELSH